MMDGGEKPQRRRGDSPVLDLQQVAHQAVTGAALHEVPLRRQEGLGVVIPVFLQEIVQQREQRLLLDLVDGHGVHHGLNHAAVGGDDEDFVWLDPERDALLFPDGLWERVRKSLRAPPGGAAPAEPLNPSPAAA